MLKNNKNKKIFFYPLYFKKIFIIFLSFFILYYIFYIKKNKTLIDLKKVSSNSHKIVIIFGTRPEAIKLIPLIKELKFNSNFTCFIINTGQHGTMVKQILDSFDMTNSIDFELNIMKKNQSLAKLTSQIIIELDKIYSLINPDAIIVQGDTTTSYAASLSAFYKKIPIFHVEAGLRTHNLYSPFPEEFNRISIDDISSLFFASTEWAAINLLKENKNPSHIFITGNTIVDSLKLTLKTTFPSEYIKSLLLKANSLCKAKNNCKIILLTCHRRENFYKPISNILKAVQKLLQNFDDIVIIFPFHLNPNVKQSIRNGLPKEVYNFITDSRIIDDINYLYFNRLLLIQPLNYIDLVHLQTACYFIMTDSGGIQEEAASIGKPVLILRNNTDRPEAVKSGSAFITGTSIDNIYYLASSLLNNEELYKKMAQSYNAYGSGNSSIIISKIIKNYFDNKLLASENIYKLNINYILQKFDNLYLNNINYDFDFQYNLIIVLTIWKRNNLEKLLMQVKRQSILKTKRTNIIVFQNFNHIDVNDIINKWKKPDAFLEKVNLTFIQSPFETGYFGRFLIPLTSTVTNNAYFIICDDDVIWGDRYFENMIRVVDEGYLATRNGRIVDKNFNEISPIADKAWKLNTHICYNEDIEYDFGGHIWAGRISWLRKAWTHIPIFIENSEDFWISAALKAYYNISTKTPKCPCPEGAPIIPDMCAASDKSAGNHINAIVGNFTLGPTLRSNLMRETAMKFNYTPLINSNPGIIENIRNKFLSGDLNHPLFDLNDSLWKDVLFWQ